MKTKIILFLALVLAGLSGWGQVKTDKEWIKNPATNLYSLEREKKVGQELIKEQQIKLNGKVDLAKTGKDLYSADEQTRLNAVDVLRYFPDNTYIQKLEEMLLNDISYEVKYHCAKALHCLNSTNSVPVLIKALKTDDDQLKMDVALALAALGEKTECFKTLKELGKTGDRNIILNTHLGYLDLATGDAVEKLKMDLSDNNSYVSVDAAIDLAELGYFKEAFPILKSKLTDGDKYIRTAALRGLAYIGTDNAIELIKGKLDDTEILVSERASLILKNCNIPFTPKSNAKGAKTSYNPTAAASYAEQWCSSFNPAYANYASTGGDCANFVSQCLKAGGMNLSNGPGLDSYGCIINCHNLNTNFTTYQGCSTSSNTYSGHLTSSYPSWFVKGDVVMFGCDASDPSVYWLHATIDVVTGTPVLDAHTNPYCSSDNKHVSYFYPSNGTGFTTGDFYHFNSTPPPANNDCSGATLLSQTTTCTPTPGTTVGATLSIAATPCTGTSDDDVWYKFVATSVTPTIQVVGAIGFDAVVDLRSGSCNGTNVSCANATSGGTETINATGLTIGSTYYVRVYSYGSSTSSQGTFTICVYGGTSGTPTVTTTAASAITNTTATSGGNVTLNGGYAVTARGVCWSTSANPVVSGSHTTNGTGNGTFTSSITGLTASTTYHIRAYATNSSGTAYGSDLTFTTTGGTPPPANNDCSGATLLSQTTTCTPTPGTTVGATLSIAATPCTGTSDDDVWYKFVATSVTPTIQVVGAIGFDAVVDLRSGSCNGTNVSCADVTVSGETETINATGLTIGSTYYIRVYSWGSSSSSQGTFTICVYGGTSGTPTVTTTAASAITNTTATSGGNVTLNGGYAVTARGVCWSTSANPVVSGSHTTDGTGNGIFTSSITGLTASTTYHIRAYATNSCGTAYGSDLTFTTTGGTPYCSGTTTLTTSTGSFTDGSGTNNYDNNSDCKWLIQPTGAISITLSFSAFATESSYDYVTVYDGTTTSASLLGSFSGTSIPASVTSTGGNMLVYFTSDGSITSAGWSASYDIITGIDKTVLNNSINIYPNPVNDNITIENTSLNNNKDAIISIYNIQGQIIKTTNNNGIETTIDLRNFSSGVYIIRVMTDREIVTKKFIKQ